MDFFKAKLIVNPADVVQLAEDEPEHWAGEALENYAPEDFVGQALVLFDDEGDPVCATAAELFGTQTVLQVQEVKLPQYIDGRLFADTAIAAFTLSREPGVVWLPITEQLVADGYV